MGINCIFNVNKPFAARSCCMLTVGVWSSACRLSYRPGRHTHQLWCCNKNVCNCRQCIWWHLLQQTCLTPEIGPGLTLWSASHCRLWLSDPIPTEHRKLRDSTSHDRSCYANETPCCTTVAYRQTWWEIGGLLFTRLIYDVWWEKSI